MRQRWLLLPAVVLSISQAASALPSRATEEECQACEQAVQSLKNDRTVCEQQIKDAQNSASGRISDFKKYFGDVEYQMKNLEPGVARLEKELSNKYNREAEAYEDLREETRNTVGSFLRRREKLTAGCHSDCFSPMCLPGDAGNGGSALVDGKCTKYASKTYGMFRYCGEGPGYDNGDTILCTGCLEDILVDRYMKCVDDRKVAQQELNGCKTKATTVKMWHTQREKQYKNKADVYIMRVSRQSDPLVAKLEESARVSASIDRIGKQVQELRTTRAAR